MPVGYTCMSIHITNKEIELKIYLFTQHSDSEPFVELCFEAGK